MAESTSSSSKFSRNVMKWDARLDDLLVREILTQKPWEHRPKSAERGAVWDRIAQVLNLLDGFNVNQRSIRDRYKNLLKKQKQTKAAEERASGIAPEPNPLDEAIAEIDELFLESDLERSVELEEKKKS